MAELNINFGVSSNAQSLEATTREINAVTDGFARLIVDEVALASSDSAYQAARTTFIKGIRRVVLGEVSRMAMLIGKNYPLADKYSGPYGQMNILSRGSEDLQTGGRGDGMSQTAKNFGFQANFERETTGIRWAKRSKKYLNWKKKNGGAARWWEHKSDLKQDLGMKGSAFYENYFGPVRVTFARPPGRGAKGRFVKHSNVLTRRGVDPSTNQSQTSNGGANVTRTGQRGKISAEYEVGRLEVSVFGRITPAMLPSLKTQNPKDSKPNGGQGVVGLFPDGPMKMKLLTRPKGAAYRYGMEPFVGFFLTRAIPNAVWRRTESLISGGGAGRTRY